MVRPPVAGHRRELPPWCQSLVTNMLLAPGSVPVFLGQVDVVVGLHGVALVLLHLHLLDCLVDCLLCDKPRQCCHSPGGQVPPVVVHQTLVLVTVLVQQRVLVQVHHLADVDTSLDRLAMKLELFGEGSQQKVTLIVKHYQMMF